MLGEVKESKPRPGGRDAGLDAEAGGGWCN